MKWTAEQWIRVLLAMALAWAIFVLSTALASVVVVPLFTPDRLSEEGAETYKEIVIAIIAVISLSMGTGLGALLVKNKVL